MCVVAGARGFSYRKRRRVLFLVLSSIALFPSEPMQAAGEAAAYSLNEGAGTTTSDSFDTALP